LIRLSELYAKDFASMMARNQRLSSLRALEISQWTCYHVSPCPFRIILGAHMFCRFCEKDKTLIKAHIIAQCLHEPILDPSGPMMIISKDPNSYPKKTPTGEYDTEILCAECDGKFSPWERYTANLLITSGAYERYKEAKANEDFYTIEKYDYSSLKLCLLSILWKMSVSTSLFKDVRLGPFEAKIRQMLQDRNPGLGHEFPIYLVRLIDAIGSVSMGTLRGTHYERNVYYLGLPGYVAIIKVDKRPTPMPLGPRVLAPGKPLIIGLKHSGRSLDSIASNFFHRPTRRKAPPSAK
jgi:hypothetical protein